MNILIVNTFFYGGGAEKIARQLYKGLNDCEGINCFFLAGRENGQIQTEQVVYRNVSIHQAVNRRLCRLKKGQRERDWYTVRKIVRIIHKEKIDLVHFHNIHGDYMGIKDITKISKYCKVVWTLHDMWAITGHCAYSCECSKWLEDFCRNCPALQLYPAIKSDKAEHIYQIKRKAFTNHKIHFVFPSEWLMKQCERSFLVGEKKTMIHNGVNIESFYPIAKDVLRKKYGISQDKLILLFAANNAESHYKGAEVLEKALHQVKRKEAYELVVVGNAKSFLFSEEYVCHYMGYIQSDVGMNELYSLSDVFIIPSRAENFPCTVIESMASGTPVIASNIGGIAEQIDENTGWLFEVGNAKQLTEMIEGLADNKELIRAMKSNCRERAVTYFSEEKMLWEYRQLYDAIIAGCL